jgi:hypothetical protein
MIERDVALTIVATELAAGRLSAAVAVPVLGLPVRSISVASVSAAMPCAQPRSPMHNAVQQRWFIGPILLRAVLLCFFLPFFSVSCSSGSWSDEGHC